jgi:hypothetical protein
VGDAHGGLCARHVEVLTMRDVEFRAVRPDARETFVLDDVIRLNGF